MVDLAMILHTICYTSVISKCNDIVILRFRCIFVFLMMMATLMMMTILTTIMMMKIMTAILIMMTIMITTMRSSDAPDI